MISKICVTFRCIHGGFGWGETGNVVRIILNGPTWADAVRQADLQKPGGWIIDKMERLEVPDA